MTTAIITSDTSIDHITGNGHPEKPDRVTAVTLSGFSGCPLPVKWSIEVSEVIIAVVIQNNYLKYYNIFLIIFSYQKLKFFH